MSKANFLLLLHLSAVQLHHLNILDVFYELIMFVYLINGSSPEAVSVS